MPWTWASLFRLKSLVTILAARNLANSINLRSTSRVGRESPVVRLPPLGREGSAGAARRRGPGGHGRGEPNRRSRPQPGVREGQSAGLPEVLRGNRIQLYRRCVRQ